MSKTEPKYKAGDRVLVDIHANMHRDPNWVEATILSVETKFAEPVYRTTRGTYHEHIIKPKE